MISERDISEKFTPIWRQNFPLLTANFMKVFNETMEIVNQTPVHIHDNIRYDLTSEVAFNLSKLAMRNDIDIDHILVDNMSMQSLISTTAKSIWSLNTNDEQSLVLNDAELNDVRLLANNVCEFIKKQEGNYKFKPNLKGYGFLPALEADLSIGDTLFEIKTVNRNFRSSDLRQLFIYLALREADILENWKYAGLYNPRKGCMSKFKVKSMVSRLTGGKSTSETFTDFLNDLTRDIQIDSNF
jgi:hypothetical protein